MQKFTHTIAIALLCGALCTATVDARGRQNGEMRGKPDKIEHQENKRHQQPLGAQRHQAKPKPQANKHGNKYGNSSLHHRPNYGKVNFGRPHRPKMHPPRPYYRPTPPPPAWRPTAWRPINTILGLTLGSLLNASIDILVNSGYNVAGYDNTTVYLNNVRMLNMAWPDANLYYGDGGLYGSEFVYSTPNYTLGRYNKVYDNLVYVYGQPYRIEKLNGGGRLATWWGNDGQYITLSFGGGMSNGGSLRYYTTLSFGR